jgi:hypothetical protein
VHACVQPVVGHQPTVAAPCTTNPAYAWVYMSGTAISCASPPASVDDRISVCLVIPAYVTCPVPCSCRCCRWDCCPSGPQQYVPLFLSKEDLDVAVAGAYQARNAAQISAVRAKAADHEAAYQEALNKVGACMCGRGGVEPSGGTCGLLFGPETSVCRLPGGALYHVGRVWAGLCVCGNWPLMLAADCLPL